MIYRIYYEGKRKFALPVKNREELLALRNSEENLAHLKAAKQGSQEEREGVFPRYGMSIRNIHENQTCNAADSADQDQRSASPQSA